MRIACPRLQLVTPPNGVTPNPVTYEASGEIGERLLSVSVEIELGIGTTFAVNLFIRDASGVLLGFAPGLPVTWSAAVTALQIWERGYEANAGQSFEGLQSFAFLPDVPLEPQGTVEIAVDAGATSNGLVYHPAFYVERWHWVELPDDPSDWTSEHYAQAEAAQAAHAVSGRHIPHGRPFTAGMFAGSGAS